MVIYSFAASRLALLAVGLLTQIFIRPLMAQAAPEGLSPHQVLSLWGRWDSVWYLGIARAGYAASRAPGAQANWAFFPAFPWLSGSLAHLAHLPVFTAMLVVSNLSFLAALYLLHRLGRAEFDRRTADAAVMLLCAAPGSYVFSAAYTESLFLAALLASLLFLRRRRWIGAGLAAGLATLTRNLGVGLLLPFAWMAGARLVGLLRQERDGRRWRLVAREAANAACGGAIPLCALAGFCLFLWARTGDPLAFAHVQAAWGRHIGDPLLAPIHGFLHPGAIPDSDLLSFAAGWTSLALLGVLALQGRWMLLSLAVFLVGAPLAAGIGSFYRYALVVAPLWLVGANLVSSRPAALNGVLLVMAILNGFMMTAWTLGLWLTA